MFALGFLASGFPLLDRAMVADVGDAVRLEQGKHRIGLLYAMITTTQKVAGALQHRPVLRRCSARSATSAKEGAVNTPAAIHGLELVYLIGAGRLRHARGRLLHRLQARLPPPRRDPRRSSTSATACRSARNPAKASAPGELGGWASPSPRDMPADASARRSDLRGGERRHLTCPGRRTVGRLA